MDFCHRPLTQKGATSQKVVLDSGFVEWVFANVSSQIELPPIPNNVNICQKCMKGYRDKKNDTINKQFIPNDLISMKENYIAVKEDCIIVKENCIDLTANLIYDISLVCFDKLKQPRKKLDGAIDIPYNLNNLATFGQIEEEILSRSLPKEWRKIELGLICYQKSSNSKADHFNLKSSDAIVAFVAECRKNKKVQLCVYSAKQKKNEVVYGSSVIEDNAEEPVPKNHGCQNLILVHCCLIAEDGRHLKLSSEMIIIWAISIIAKINGVDATHLPLTKLFDKINYRYPNSKRPLEDYQNNNSTEGDSTPIVTTILSEKTKPNLATVHLKKKSPYKPNIQITKGMTFQDIIKYAFPMGPPEGKRFVIKSSLDIDGKAFLSEQIIEEVFF
ncbi:hypothetical protein GLOIN_2v1787544 [Rhizophagus clarus]|uniref:Uncharacterized protein n=1 Tax=Rhizophagus clarus TaxID=94130 RepID=A0A8H3QS40_9GLOM|nr:hypothetical protein GLOIN_2v1787544 [Rhizophagus clarus]